MSAAEPAFLFDLDGTLADSVYQHVLAWREALAAVGIGWPSTGRPAGPPGRGGHAGVR